MVFFEPSEAFVAWLAAHAAGRVVVDCGCGDGDLLRRLLARGVKAIGVDPWWALKDGFDPRLQVLPLPAQKAGFIHSHPAVLVVARPDHGGWVDELVDHAHPGSEILYVGKPCNVREDLVDREVEEVVDAPPCLVERVYRVVRDNHGQNQAPDRVRRGRVQRV